MRLLLLLLLALIAACPSADPASPDPVPYAGVVEVSLARDADGRAALRLVAVGDPGCDDPLVVETDASAERLDVRVVGIVPLQGLTCDAPIPASATVPLPFTAQGGFPVTVTHRGSADAYAYSIGVAGERLDAVQTSATRLATP